MSMGAKFFQSLGIDTYQLRKSSSKDEPSVVSDWSRIESKVSNCTKCILHKGRTNTVFGDGNKDSDWFFVGEAPGKDEDIQGKPFVGRAGRLLTEVIFSMGLSREDVFIANILKCRPPDNRDPKSEEVQKCIGYLQKQINLVNPKVIVAVGRIAAHSLLKTDLPMGKLRGKLHNFETSKGSIPTLVIYHPAYLLRSPSQKRKVWEDLQVANELLKDA